MQVLSQIKDVLNNLNIYGATVDAMDIVEVFIIAAMLYFILKWMKNTKAWALLRGLVVIGVLLTLAYFLRMTTILWLARNILSFAVIALIVVLQPEIRKALEDLGKNKIFGAFFNLNSVKDTEQITLATINEIVKACSEMAKVRTGSLIVIERRETLQSFEETGITVDGAVTNQLLINIFEKNTPLHDGAVIIRGNRIASATCYLHLSTNTSISKELGTRHRAGLGVSEETDAVTIIVSEETGRMALAVDGLLERNITSDVLRTRLSELLLKPEEEDEHSRKIGRRRQKKA